MRGARYGGLDSGESVGRRNGRKLTGGKAGRELAGAGLLGRGPRRVL